MESKMHYLVKCSGYSPPHQSLNFQVIYPFFRLSYGVMLYTCKNKAQWIVLPINICLSFF